VFGDSLIVTDTRDGHARIAECLTALRNWAGLPCSSLASENRWLSRLVSLHCREKPLGEALEQLAQENGLPMVVQVDTTPPNWGSSVVVVSGDWDDVPLAQVLEEISPKAPLDSDCSGGFLRISWRDPTPRESMQFFDVEHLLDQYPELSGADLTLLIHSMVPQLGWDQWQEAGDLCVLAHCLAIYHTLEVGKQVQACLEFLGQLPEGLPRPAVVRYPDSQMATEQLRQFFGDASSHLERNATRRLEVSYALVMTSWLAGSSGVGQILDDIPQEELDVLISELKNWGPSVPSAVPFLFRHLDGPSGSSAAETLKAIDPHGRQSWNLFRELESQADGLAQQRVWVLEEILQRQFGAPRE
jgi:hypothetical protein